MRKLIGLTAIIGGVLLVLTPRYILPACEYEGFPRMHCSDTAHAEMILGGVFIAVGIAAMVLKSAASTIAAGIAGFVLSLVSFWFPDKFGYCMSSRMPCNYGMVPAVRFLAVTISVIMAVGVIVAAKRSLKKGTA